MYSHEEKKRDLYLFLKRQKEREKVSVGSGDTTLKEWDIMVPSENAWMKFRNGSDFILAERFAVQSAF